VFSGIENDYLHSRTRLISPAHCWRLNVVSIGGRVFSLLATGTIARLAFSPSEANQYALRIVDG